MPITRRNTARVINLNEEASRVRHRYGRTNTTLSPVRSRSSGTGRRAASPDVPIAFDGTSFESNYMGRMIIGTPPQTLNVVLDTCSSDLWIIGDSCQQCSGSAPSFKSSASRTFKNIGDSLVFTMGFGSIAGKTMSDTATMGGFTIEGQTMLNVQSATLSVNGTSGVLGLGFQGGARTKAVPFWQALINRNLLLSPEFGFYLRRSESTKNGQLSGGGVFTLGGTNSTLFTGDIEFMDMPSTGPNGLWLLSTTGLALNGQNISIPAGTNAVAVISTGTSLIGGPTAVVKAFWAAVPNSSPVDLNEGFFSFPCGQELSVSMSFGGKLWPISTQDMNVGTLTNDTSRCIGAIFDLGFEPSDFPGKTNPGWVVGDAFLKNVYSVFRADPPSIGFAELASNISEFDIPDSGLNSKQNDAIATTAFVYISVVPVLISAVLFNMF